MKRIGTTPFFLLAVLSTACWASPNPTLMELHVFAGGHDGGIPYAGLTYWHGALYGVTDIGGTGDCGRFGRSGCGTVFKLTRPATPGAAWTKTVLYDFAGGTTDGASPQSAPLFGKHGEIYGTTASGGMGVGIVYELTPPAPGGTAWSEQVLHFFSGVKDGASPNGALIMDNAGALYGTAESGGKGFDGVAYRLSPPAAGQTAWTESVLHHFSGTDGSGPLGGLMLGPWGMLYGTTQTGGRNEFGTVFLLTPPATNDGAWKETVLHSFAGGTDGAAPLTSLVADDTGALYGTTAEGGGAVCAGTSGCGTVFQLRPPAYGRAAWQESVVYAFQGNTDGAFANSPLSIDAHGVLYGATLLGGGTACGGTGCGTAFTLTPPPGGGVTWSETMLHRFAGGSDGAYPQAPILPARQAVLFGSTAVGPLGNCGSHLFPQGCGTLFKMRLWR